MRVISKKKLKSFWIKHARSKNSLSKWYKIVSKAQWTSLADIRETFPHTDQVKTAKGNRVIVFNLDFDS